MIFINNLVSVLIFINLMFSDVSLKDCDVISNFFIKNDLFILNSTEHVVFLPSDFEYETGKWSDFDKNDIKYPNLVTYNYKVSYSLSKTNMNISNEELTNAIYKSLVNNKQLDNLVGVFPDRYVVKTGNTTQIFSIDYSYSNLANLDTDTKCEKFQIQYKKSKIKGLICNISFVAGLRYIVKCGNIELQLMPINTDSYLEFEMKCIT